MLGLRASVLVVLVACAVYFTAYSTGANALANTFNLRPGHAKQLFYGNIAPQEDRAVGTLEHLPKKPKTSHMGLFFAQDKGNIYTLDSSEAQRIRDLQSFYGLEKWGFIIYRCTYGDDDAWTQFMSRLDQHRDRILRDHYRTPDLVDSYDWDVQHDPTLHGATKDEVRRRFKQWRATNSQAEVPDHLEGYKRAALLRENPRYNYCIHVDAEAMQSVLEQSAAYIDAGAALIGYVNLIRADESWDLPDFDRFDWSVNRPLNRDVPRNEDEVDGDVDEDDEYDEGELDIEGSRLHDVGWMKVKVESLLPEMYATLVKGFMWDKLYRRPPTIVER